MINRTEEEIMKNWEASDKPLVTIRCLAYNHEKYISQALDGFLMQETDFPFEILVHDDASTDQTAEIIREYEKRFPNIMRPIYETENQYSKKDGSIRRIMREHTRGKYIAVCEGDDYWTAPDKLQRQIGYMRRHPDCTMTFHAVNYVRDGEVIKNDRVAEKECDIPAERIIEGGGIFCSTLSLCFITELAYLKPKFRQMDDAGDYTLQILLASKGRVHYYPEAMGCYRTGHAESWTTKMKKTTASWNSHLHANIEMLKVFNSDTDHKYNDSVYRMITKRYVRLYFEGEEDAYALAKESAGKIKDKKQRNARMRFIHRVWLKKHFPVLNKLAQIRQNKLHQDR